VKLGYAPAAPVQMQTVVEEECTGNGCLHIANKFKADAVIIPEPFNQTIVTAQLGVMWFRGKYELCNNIIPHNNTRHLYHIYVLYTNIYVDVY
jgi:hypothetical protein